MGMSPTDRNIKKEIRFLRAFSLRLVTDPLIKRQTFMGGKKEHNQGRLSKQLSK